MNKERAPEPAGWIATHRFKDAQTAVQAYEAIRDLLLTDDIDASVFRFTLDGVSHVGIVGETSLGDTAAEKIDLALKRGTNADVPPSVVHRLRRRRQDFKGLKIDFLERRSGRR